MEILGFVFKDGNFLKMTRALIGEGAIMGLFEDITFRPPQGGHGTHVWDDSAIQKIFICVVCLTEGVWTKIHVLDRVRVQSGS